MAATTFSIIYSALKPKLVPICSNNSAGLLAFASSVCFVEDVLSLAVCEQCNGSAMKSAFDHRCVMRRTVTAMRMNVQSPRATMTSMRLTFRERLGVFLIPKYTRRKRKYHAIARAIPSGIRRCSGPATKSVCQRPHAGTDSSERLATSLEALWRPFPILGNVTGRSISWPGSPHLGGVWDRSYPNSRWG